jgi:hypothetical protein
VYGGSDKAIIVNKGEGTANITVTSAENASVKTSFKVTVAAEIVEPEEPTGDITFSKGGVDMDTGEVIENNARLISDLVVVDAHSYITIKSNDGYLIKAFGYSEDGVFMGQGGICGGLDTSSARSIPIVAGTSFRILLKKSNNANFTQEEAESASVSVVYESAVAGSELKLTLGSFNGSAETASNTRARSSLFIPVDTSKNVSVVPSFGDYYFIFKGYDESLNYIADIKTEFSGYDPSAGWCKNEGQIDVSKNNMNKIKYVRLWTRRADDSNITLPIMGTITFDGVTYTLT